jgi:hypothetical protein
MWAFEHVRSLGKGLLSCQQRILVSFDQLSTYYTNPSDYPLPFCFMVGVRIHFAERRSVMRTELVLSSPRRPSHRPEIHGKGQEEGKARNRSLILRFVGVSRRKAEVKVGPGRDHPSSYRYGSRSQGGTDL